MKTIPMPISPAANRETGGHMEAVIDRIVHTHIKDVVGDCGRSAKAS